MALRRTVQESRTKAFEEAVEACEAIERSAGYEIWNDAVDKCVERIRALAGE